MNPGKKDDLLKETSLIASQCFRGMFFFTPVPGETKVFLFKVHFYELLNLIFLFLIFACL